MSFDGNEDFIATEAYAKGLAYGTASERARIAARLREVALAINFGVAFFASPEVALTVIADEIERGSHGEEVRYGSSDERRR